MGIRSLGDAGRLTGGRQIRQYFGCLAASRSARSDHLRGGGGTGSSSSVAAIALNRRPQTTDAAASAPAEELPVPPPRLELNLGSATRGHRCGCEAMV